MVKFIETKRRLELYSFDELKVVVEAGHLNNVRYVVEHGVDINSMLVCGEHYVYVTLIVDMWKRVIICAKDKIDLNKYLYLQLEISGIDAAIGVLGGDYPKTLYKGGIRELTVILEGRKKVLVFIAHERLDQDLQTHAKDI